MKELNGFEGGLAVISEKWARVSSRMAIGEKDIIS